MTSINDIILRVEYTRTPGSGCYCGSISPNQGYTYPSWWVTGGERCTAEGHSSRFAYGGPCDTEAEAESELYSVADAFAREGCDVYRG